MGKKKRTLFLILILSFSGIIFILSQYGIISEKVSSLVKQRINAALLVPIDISKISYNPFGKIILNDVTIFNPAKTQEKLLSIKRVNITFSILSFLKGYKSPSKITLIEPHFYLLQDYNGNFNISFPVSNLQKPQIFFKRPIKFIIRKGILNLASSKYNIDTAFQNIYGFGLFTKETVKCSIKASNISGWGRRIISNISYRKGTVQLDCVIEEARVSNYNKLNTILPQFSFTEGVFNSSFQILYSTERPLQYSGELEINKGRILYNTFKFNDISGKVIFDTNDIITKQITFSYQGKKWQIKGNINNYRNKPEMSLDATGNLALNEVNRFVSTKFLLKGELNCGISIKGDFTAPKLKFWFFLDKGRIGNINILDVKGHFNYKNNILKIITLYGGISKGNFISSGSINFKDKQSSLTVLIKNLNLNYKNIKTHSLLEANIKGNIESPFIEGRIYLKDMIISKRSFPQLNIDFLYKRNYFSIKGNSINKKYSINAVSVYDKNEKLWSIRKANIFLPKQAQITLTGQFSFYKERFFSGKITCKNIDKHDIPLTLPTQLKGRFNATLDIDVSREKSYVKGKIDSTGLRYKNEDIQFLAQIYCDKNSLTLTDIRLNNIKGKLQLLFKPSKHIKGNIIISKENLNLLVLPLSLKEKLNGEVYGNIIFNLPFKKEAIFNSALLNIKLKINNFSGKGFSCDLIGINGDINNGDVKLTSIKLKKHNGILNISMSTKLKNLINPITAKFIFTDFPIVKDKKLKTVLSFIGKFRFNDEFEISGKIKSSNLLINNFPFGLLTSDIFLNTNGIRFTSLKVNENLKGYLNILHKSIKGNLLYSSNKMLNLFKLFGLPEIDGKLNVNLDLSGEISKPIIKGRFIMDDALYLNQKFSLNSDFLYRDKRFSFNNLNLVFPKGNIYSYGGISFINSTVDIKGKIKHLNLKSLKFLKTCEGLINGKFSLKGNLKSPEFSIISNIVNFKLKRVFLDRVETDLTIFFSKPVKVVFNLFKANLNSGIISISKLNKSIMLLNKKKCNFDLFLNLRNIKYSNVLFFGEIGLSGETNLKSLKMVVSLSDIWINQYEIIDKKVSFYLDKNKILFLPVEKSPTQLLGEITEQDKVYKLKSIGFYQDERKNWNIEGTLGQEYLDIGIEIFPEGADVNSILKLFNIKDVLFGQLQGRFKIKKQKNKSLSIYANAEVTKGKIYNLDFDFLRFKGITKEGKFVVEELKCTKEENYTISVVGYKPVKIEQVFPFSIDVNINGNLNIIKIIPSFAKEAKGPVDASFHIASNEQNIPVINGYIKVNYATLTLSSIFRRIKDFSVDILVTDNHFNIKNIEGKIKNGILKVYGGFDLKNLRIENIDLNIETVGEHGIFTIIPFLKIPASSVFILPGSGRASSSEVKLDIKVAGNQDRYLLKGLGILENAHFTYPPKTKDTQGIRLVFLDPAYWDLEIKAGNNTWFENNFADVLIEGSLHLKGPSNNIVVNGNLQTERGSINYLGTEFNVKYAKLACLKGQLYLEGEAQTYVDDDIISMEIERGPIGEKQPKFSSLNEPELSSEQALVKATGLSFQEYSSDQKGLLLRREILRIVDATLTSPIVRQVIKRTGIVDVMDIDLGLFNRGEKTQLRFGRYFGNSLFLGYNVGLDRRFTDKLSLYHRLEILYRLKWGGFIKGRIGDRERYIGFERRLRF